MQNGLSDTLTRCPVLNRTENDATSGRPPDTLILARADRMRHLNSALLSFCPVYNGPSGRPILGMTSLDFQSVTLCRAVRNHAYSLYQSERWPLDADSAWRLLDNVNVSRASPENAWPSSTSLCHLKNLQKLSLTDVVDIKDKSVGRVK